MISRIVPLYELHSFSFIPNIFTMREELVPPINRYTSLHDGFCWFHKRLNLQCRANEPYEFNKHINMSITNESRLRIYK